LIDRVRGKVWRIVTPGEKPGGGLIVVSTRQLETGVEYRALGEPPAQVRATPVEPGLEDGYIWLMHRLCG
jgi:ABC-2 type transport system ATP-binding protein